ncbi:MAG: hypothetical protein QXS17_02435 [Candidatus Micrarchaeaceae archaeon]
MTAESKTSPKRFYREQAKYTSSSTNTSYYYSDSYAYTTEIVTR